jgi:uncharacterized protein YndB with AHSA1/START domain
MENQNQQIRNPQTSELKEREMIFTRVLNAPRELVFDAWTKPEHLAEWWGPNGFSLTTNTMDVKPGGRWDFMMHGPDGRDYPNRVMYTEIVKPERLVYKHTGDGDTEDVKFNVTVSFEDIDGKTRLTMHSVFETPEELAKVVKEYGAYEGAKQTLKRLQEYLEKL